jgi:ribosomal protein S1
MKKKFALVIGIILLLSTAIIAATYVKGTVIGVKEGQVLIDVGNDSKKFSKGDKVKIEKEESKEKMAPSLQGC